MYEIIIEGISIMVVRDNNLENELGLVFPHSNHLQMTKCYPHSKRGNLLAQIRS
jgi:hypothetical protein